MFPDPAIHVATQKPREVKPEPKGRKSLLPFYGMNMLPFTKDFDRGGLNTDPAEGWRE